MKSFAAIILCAVAIDAFSFKSITSHFHKRGADLNKCLRANVEAYGWCTGGASCPPCWIKNGEKYDCYDYKSGSTCDNWSGMFDRTKSSGGSKYPAASCNKGNLGTLCYPDKETCPPCWTQNGGKWDCYEFGGNTKQCPWGGMTNTSA